MITREQKQTRQEARTNLGYAAVNVYLENIQEKADFKARICDISPLGVKFVSDKFFPKESMIYLGLVLSTLGAMLYFPGKVVRSEQKKEKEYHVAVEFLGDYLLQSCLKEYISSKKI